MADLGSLLGGLGGGPIGKAIVSLDGLDPDFLQADIPGQRGCK